MFASLLPSRGLAWGSRLVLTDVGCQTPGGCTPPPNVSNACAGLPGGICPPDEEGAGAATTLYPPPLPEDTFGPAYALGARISLAAWGTGGGNVYGTEAAVLDGWVMTAPDALLLFAGGESEEGLGAQAVAKNVLSVGASRDGFLGHYGKVMGVPDSSLEALFQPGDGRSCGARIAQAQAQGVLTDGGCPNPALLTPALCWQLTQTPLEPWLGGYTPTDGTGYGSASNLDLAFCCACTPVEVATGASADGTNSPAFSAFLLAYQGGYNSRIVTDVSAHGPTLDGRIKPDLVAPGLEIVSARSGGATALSFGTTACSDSYSIYTGGGGATNQATGRGLNVSDALFSMSLAFFEPALLHTVTLTLGAADAGTLAIALVSTSDVAAVAPIYLSIPAAVSTSTNFTWVVDYELGAGWSGSLLVFVSNNTLVRPADGPNASTAACFGSLTAATVALNLVFTRVGGASYVVSKSGTSSAAAIMSGVAALVRQYFTR